MYCAFIIWIRTILPTIWTLSDPLMLSDPFWRLKDMLKVDIFVVRCIMGLINSVLWIVFFDKFFSISQLNSHLYIFFFHLTSFKKLPHIRLSGSTYIRLSRQGIFQLFTWPSSRAKRIEFTLLFLALVHQWKQVHMWKFCNAIFESCVTKTEFPFRRLLFLFWGCVTLFCISLSFQWYM